MSSLIEETPLHVLINVFYFLPASDLVQRVGCVCHDFNLISKEPEIWHNLCHSTHQWPTNNAFATRLVYSIFKYCRERTFPFADNPWQLLYFLLSSDCCDLKLYWGSFTSDFRPEHSIHRVFKQFTNDTSMYVSRVRQARLQGMGDFGVPSTCAARRMPLYQGLQALQGLQHYMVTSLLNANQGSAIYPALTSSLPEILPLDEMKNEDEENIPQFYVKLINDDVHSFQEVCSHLKKILKCHYIYCEALMLFTHFQGEYVIKLGTKEECQEYSDLLNRVNLDNKIGETKTLPLIKLLEFVYNGFTPIYEMTDKLQYLPSLTSQNQQKESSQFYQNNISNNNNNNNNNNSNYSDNNNNNNNESSEQTVHLMIFSDIDPRTAFRDVISITDLDEGELESVFRMLFMRGVAILSGGTKKNVEHMANRLQERGHSVLIVDAEEFDGFYDEMDGLLDENDEDGWSSASSDDADDNNNDNNNDNNDNNELNINWYVYSALDDENQSDDDEIYVIGENDENDENNNTNE